MLKPKHSYITVMNTGLKVEVESTIVDLLLFLSDLDWNM